MHWRRQRLLWFMKQVHQPAEAMQLGGITDLYFSSFESWRAHRRMPVLVTTYRRTRFDSICHFHAALTFSFAIMHINKIKYLTPFIVFISICYNIHIPETFIIWCECTRHATNSSTISFFWLLFQNNSIWTCELLPLAPAPWNLNW